MNSLYRNYRTRKFSDIFKTQDEFLSFYNDCGIPAKITEENATTLYYLLIARHANSHIASSDETRFKMACMSTIFQYGPTWQKELEIQDTLRDTSLEDIMKGAVAINNKAFNPSVAPSTDTLEELPYINEQTTQKFKKGILDAYNQLDLLLKSDVTGKFLARFDKLFTVFPAEVPIWYRNVVDNDIIPEEEEEEEEENDDND